ncbi:MAG: PQQ-binding-like beta-propeller repeat protein [Gemmatimonadota bacterium]
MRSAFACLAVLLLAPLPAARGQSAPEPAHTTPSAAAVSVPPLEILWRGDIRNGATAPALVTPERVYVATARQDVKAFDRARPRELWSQRIGPGFSAPPVLAGGVLVVASPHPDAAAYGLEPATGRRRWESPAGDVAQAPIVSGGRVVLLSVGGRVTAIEAASGDEAWNTRVEGVHPGPASAALTAGGLFTLSAEGTLVRLDPSSGDRLASRRTGRSSVAVLATPGGESVLAVGHDGTVQAFGREADPLGPPFPTAAMLHAPAAAGDRLVVPGSDRVLRSFALPSGEPLWERAFEVAFAAPPVFSPDAARVAVGDLAGGLWTLDAAAGTLLSRTTGPRAAVVPTWADGVLATVAPGGDLLVLHPEPGEREVRASSPSAPQ